MPLPFEYGFTNFIPHFSDVLLYRRIRQTQISMQQNLSYNTLINTDT